MKITDLDTFTRAYVECALWSSAEYAFGECPCCGKLARLDHYPEPEFEQVPMCAEEGCGVREIANPEPMDKNYGFSDIAPETLQRIVEDCKAFQSDNAQDLEAISEIHDSSDAGRDFWLNRNGHGAGFWDRYYGDDKELRASFLRLSDASKAWGSFDLYVGDDGLIYA